MAGQLMWKETYRDYWWHDATAQFCDLRLQDEGQVQIIALEYAAPDQRGDVTLGYDMNTRERTGLLQHVAQRAALSWCFRAFGDRADISFVLGFATDLVIDVLDENNARSGGSGKSSSTEGQGGFIPGAPGQGGGMPTQTADSGWRLSRGKDYFARPLRHAQKAGEHEADDSKDKLGHFLLNDVKKTRRHLVSAPFLGTVALGREEVPLAFLDDYLEFHRAYRAAFVHWLQTSSKKGKAESADCFRQLLQQLQRQQEGVSLDAICQAIYELPLTDAKPLTDTLERRFLGWIAAHSR